MTFSLLTDLNIDGKRHDEHGDHDVSNGQRYDEVVSDVLEALLPVDAHTDEYIPEHREDGKED